MVSIEKSKYEDGEEERHTVCRKMLRAMLRRKGEHSRTTGKDNSTADDDDAAGRKSSRRNGKAPAQLKIW